MYTEGKEVAVHADLRDAGQTVYLPKIRTHAQDGINEIDHTEALEKATIIDTVTYTNLLPGKEYTVTGTLMNKVTGEAVLIDGKKVTASTIFTAEKAEGSPPAFLQGGFLMRKAFCLRTFTVQRPFRRFELEYQNRHVVVVSVAAAGNCTGNQFLRQLLRQTSAILLPRL